MKTMFVPVNAYVIAPTIAGSAAAPSLRRNKYMNPWHTKIASAALSPTAYQAGTKKNVQLNGATFAVSGGMPAGVPAAMCGSHVCQSRSSSERSDMISAGPNCSTWSPWVGDAT
jgi:hypothetical protein